MNLPLQYGRESLQVLNENVSRFKEAIKAGEAERRDNDQKVNCVNKVRNLIRNYKSVV